MAGFKQSFVQALTEVSSTAKDQVGDLRREGNKTYMYVKLQNTTATVAGVAGDPVAYAVADSAADTPHVVTDHSDAAAVPVFAGVLVAAVAGVLATAYYLWIQVGGPVTSNPAVVGTIGQAIKLAAADKTWAAMAAFTDAPAAVIVHVASKKLLLINRN